MDTDATEGSVDRGKVPGGGSQAQVFKMRYRHLGCFSRWPGQERHPCICLSGYVEVTELLSTGPPSSLHLHPAPCPGVGLLGGFRGLQLRGWGSALCPKASHTRFPPSFQSLRD